jgi:cbb3-type cytochrome oxidase maturation protein
MQRDSLREVPRGEPSVPGLNWFLWIFGPLVILVAGTAFIFKLIEFVHTATTTGPDAMGSFLMPVLTYLLVAAGYLLLFLWAYASGQFRDVEGPKYRMLEMQDEIDRRESGKPANTP